VSDLISIGKNSLDTKKQLCALLNAWRMGMKDYNDILKLYNTYRQAKDLMLADSLAIDYKFYLNQVSENELLVKENLDFMASISKMITSKDRLFYLAYMQPLKIDSVTKQHWAADMVNSIIGKEEIRSDLEQVKNHPMEDSDWCRLRSLIKKKYPKIDANKIVLKEAISFYRKNKDWEKYTQYRTAYNDSYLNPDADAFLGLNGPAWDVFRHSSNRRALEQALDWSDFSIQLAKPGSNSLLQYLDTRANLLYKLGRIKEAVEQEERAISLSIELGMLTKSSAIKNSFYDEYVLNLNKMKNNIPTW
jgi:tetratricopeptide (TPR) repeat protein